MTDARFAKSVIMLRLATHTNYVPVFSSPAFSTPANLVPRFPVLRFPVLRFQLPRYRTAVQPQLCRGQALVKHKFRISSQMTDVNPITLNN